MKIFGAFRDQSNELFEAGNFVLRVVNRLGFDKTNRLIEAGIYQDLVDAGLLIESQVVSVDQQKKEITIKHKRIPFISYPYEWGLPFLISAAKKSLQIMLYQNKNNVTLKDCTPYNIQFNSGELLLIDFGSLDEYNEGDYWTGFEQYIQSFYNPIYLGAKKGLQYNSWYRGALEGIKTRDLRNLLGLRDFFNLGVILNVVLKSRIERKQLLKKNLENVNKLNLKKINRGSYLNLINIQLYLLRKMELHEVKTVWIDYAHNHSYRAADELLKINAVTKYLKKYRPITLLDIGCNTGNFSKLALKLGVEFVVAIDSDVGCINRLADEVLKDKLNILPLLINIQNESPSQGWMGKERVSFSERRAICDGVLALAVIHHMVIASNLPMDQAIVWIIGDSKSGLIEFVDKSDIQVKKLLQNREDTFSDYTIENFERILKHTCKTLNVIEQNIPGRFIYEYAR
jgi:predicted rRNA methylase YqxC with S4 and FtsJ domains